MQKIVIKSLFVINLAVIILFWWTGSSSLLLGASISGLLIALGRIAGLLAEFFILTELVLISRIPFIERAYGFDNLNKLHRWIGYGLLSGILSHPILLIFGYAIERHVSLWQQTLNFLTSWEDVAKALIALTIVITVGIISLPVIKRKFRYESWHVIHLLMYVAIGLVLGHQINTADVSTGIALYYWLALNFLVFGGVLFYRVLHPFILFNRHRFNVEKIVQETHDVHSVYITGRNMDKFTFEAGQYIHVSFLTKGMWQPHPFSISLAPNGKHIRISPKALGDFTSKIKDLTAGTKVIIEGPFGRFTERAAKYEKYLLIAGGIGITPIRALAESLSQKNRDAILLYGNKTENDIVFKDELQNLAPQGHYVLSEKTNGNFESGYIDEAKIKKFVPDLKERDIYICGPVGMMSAVTSILKNLGISKSQIHFEKFSY